MRTVVFGWALVSVVGCSGADASPSANAYVDLGPTPTGEPGTSATALARREEAPPSALDAWTLPGNKGAKLGEACTPRPPDADGKPNGSETCGADGRVVLEYDSFRPMRGARPCTMHKLEREDGRNMFASSGCVDGDHLVLTSDCMVCRTTSGWAAHARLSELTPAQSRFLFGRLGVGDEASAPTTPADWRAFVSKAPLEPPQTDMGLVPQP